MVVDGHITRQEIVELKRQHEEADTRIVWSIKHASEQMLLPNIVARCADTDICLFTLPHNTH